MELCTRQFAPDENLVRFIELAREAVCDPGLPKPCQERITEIPRYAAWLFVHGEALAHTTYEVVAAYLQPQWRAVAATQRPDCGTIFLEEVEQALYRFLENLPVSGHVCAIIDPAMDCSLRGVKSGHFSTLSY